MKTTDDMICDTDLICFSYLRWDADYQCPQYFMERFSTLVRVFYIEEPVFESSRQDYTVKEAADNIFVITPILPESLSKEEIPVKQQEIMERLFFDYSIKKYWNWYYTPSAFAFTFHLKPELAVYDRINELSLNNTHRDVELEELKNRLLLKADIIFQSDQYVSMDDETEVHVKQRNEKIWEKKWHKIYGKIYGIIYDKYMHSRKIEMYTSRYENYYA